MIGYFALFVLFFTGLLASIHYSFFTRSRSASSYHRLVFNSTMQAFYFSGPLVYFTIFYLVYADHNFDIIPGVKGKN